MIEVLPLLSQRLPDVVLVVAGTGPEEARLRSQARRHKARVIFAGHVQDERVAEVYSTADVFVLPSADRWLGLDTEGLGVVLLEAAACGVPSVAGASGGTSEAVVQGRTGFVVDARDKGALTKAVAWTLEHPEQARRMGAAGRAYVESEFSRRELPTSLTEWLR
jgi:phosphatidylinositol alpha-1,6-mannosyltransferase